MIRRPLVLALAFVLAPSLASAEDLMQTYELARAGDPQFSAAEANRLAVREGAVQARAQMLPQLGGSASLTRNRSDNDGTQVIGGTPIPGGASDSSSESTTRQYGLRLDQMIFDRARFTTLKSQKALSEASDYQLESAGDNLITRTSAAYFTVLVQLETLAAAQAAEDAAKKQFDYADKRLEVGLAPITDVYEARAQYESARAITILSRNTLEDAYQALAEITGQPVRNLKGLPMDFQPELPNALGADDWVQTAIDNNPALQAKEYQLASAEADVSTARAGHWPTLYLGGNYGDTNNDGSSTNNITQATSDYENNARSRSIGVTLSVPIYSGGGVQSGVRQALARRDIVQDELVQQRRALERNARNAYQTVVAGISEVEARRLALVSAQSAYDASNVGLEVGTRTVLDVLQNQRTLFEAQRAYAEARYNYLQSRLLLEQAAGTLDAEDVMDVNRLLTANAEADVKL
ncbi:TolC family outer membrane protein [Marilutibacter aestuarii]|uniref:TolC family outer membrane protein n=1 Tax=Marilutibacter aestuarii TaxID=1706195 RepID=A0A508AQI4_9GAMM|nr:TolC family outer membrane protein [Lysobacter aestuarii]TQD51717.1 TolC family outer membrane protein [Lysobacter aestuarii]